jgi:hypothetical protein
MTLVLEGMPSAGGPRSRRGSRAGLSSLVSVAVGWLVLSVKGRTSPVAVVPSAPSSPLA